MHYVVNIRALTEIGTEDAGRILERQLQRRLTSDQLEQSWYWIDLANGLRNLNRQQSLPHLLRCSEAAGDLPLAHYFAAETVCFLEFPGYLRQLHSPLGRAALRTLHRALEGLRYGVQPQVFFEGRLGEVIEDLWDHKGEQINPLVVRVFGEALRQLRRAPHGEAFFVDEVSDQEAFQWQMSRLAALESALDDYLHDAPAALAAMLPKAPKGQITDILLAIDDLRGEAGPALLPMLGSPSFPCPDLGVRVLTWSRDPRVGPWLRDWAQAHVPPARRGGEQPRIIPRRAAIPNGFPYQTILRSLRGHPSPETERFLLQACRDRQAALRATAVSSLGWWEPMEKEAVLRCLGELRCDANAEVRQAARAALARLGERQALHGFRLALASEDSQRVHEAVQLAASEGLTLLWPDLDKLVDGDDQEVALFAREALERLREDLPIKPPPSQS
jgi:hypothetical protein